ncbi:thioredoxin domain-containing protein [uncultured Cytophaga sp.]|uniref:thioredoxin domain-containing protein n=1 Tax=uncultured Cytophaga sp. TaxID=160238 RepID=UPI00263528F2|nr:thioredoxin domain-containing protein [uncultured Cytophaga sp.]
MKQIFIGMMVVFFATSLSACSNQQSAAATNDTLKLNALQFSNMVKATANPTLLDVRSEEEFNKEHIKNAKNVNWNGSDFKTQVAPLNKKEPVFVYCLSGGRSASAANYLRSEGFEKVYELDGGMLKWNAATLPVEKGNTPSVAQSEQEMSLVEFQKLLETDKYVLVDFYAIWCGPCKQMEPDLKDIAETMSDKVTVVRIDVDKNPTLSQHFEIESLPAIHIYKNKKLVYDDIGYKTKKQLVNQLK